MSIQEKITQRVSEIAQDNTSGSSEIARRAAVAFLETIADVKEQALSPVQPLRSAVAIFAKELLKAQPKMATLFNLVNRALLIVNSHTTLGDARVAVEKHIYSFLAIVVGGSDSITLKIQHAISENSVVLVHSYSATVNKVLINIKNEGRSFEVFVTESRPMLEGRKTAQALVSANIGVNFIVDSAAFFAVQRSTIVLFGADAITKDGMVNKIGTSLIALAAKTYNKPCYILADSTKLLPTSYKLALEDMHTKEEVWPEAQDSILVLNRYFETTPLDLFTAVVNEYGVLKIPEVKLHLTNLGVSSELCTEL
jgi:translation initiation factor eIF-2B subunit delta